MTVPGRLKQIRDRLDKASRQRAERGHMDALPPEDVRLLLGIAEAADNYSDTIEQSNIYDHDDQQQAYWRLRDALARLGHE